MPLQIVCVIRVLAKRSATCRNRRTRRERTSRRHGKTIARLIVLAPAEQETMNCWESLSINENRTIFTQMLYYCFSRVQPVAAWFLKFCWLETHILDGI